jgi:hypothetical protein
MEDKKEESWDSISIIIIIIIVIVVDGSTALNPIHSH